MKSPSRVVRIKWDNGCKSLGIYQEASAPRGGGLWNESPSPLHVPWSAVHFWIHRVLSSWEGSASVLVSWLVLDALTRLGPSLNFGARLGSWYPSLTWLHGARFPLNHKHCLWPEKDLPPYSKGKMGPLGCTNPSFSHPQEPGVSAAGCYGHNPTFCQH